MAPPRPRSASSTSTAERSKRLRDEEAARDAKRISDRIDATLEAERNVYKKFKRVYKILLLGTYIPIPFSPIYLRQSLLTTAPGQSESGKRRTLTA